MQCESALLQIAPEYVASEADCFFILSPPLSLEAWLRRKRQSFGHTLIRGINPPSCPCSPPAPTAQSPTDQGMALPIRCAPFRDHFPTSGLAMRLSCGRRTSRPHSRPTPRAGQIQHLVNCNGQSNLFFKKPFCKSCTEHFAANSRLPEDDLI
jgi:hypothetical protein